MTKQTIANFLKQLRKTSGLSVNEVTDKLQEYGIDISAKTLYGYESGLSMLNADAFVALCKIYKCDNPLEIFGTPTVKSNEMRIVEKYRSLDLYGQETISYILDREVKRVSKLAELKEKIPNILLEVPTNHTPVRYISYHQRTASAGNGQIVFEDMPVDRIEIPDIPKYKRVSYAIGVNGQSMEPLYNNGDILLIEPTCQIEAGEIGIFIVDGEAFVKKLGEGELISLNKGYPNITLTEYSNCMGRVVDKLHKAELL